MNKMELWDKKVKDEFEYLDSIDVSKYLVDNKDVYACMIQIKEDCDKDYCQKYNDDYGLFNYTGTDDFLDYYTKRYPNISYNEITTYYVLRSDN